MKEQAIQTLNWYKVVFSSNEMGDMSDKLF